MSKLFQRINLLALALIFIWFTWRGMLWFYSADDMMNTSFAWDLSPWRILRAQFMIWLPAYRPLGAAVYRIFYYIFGFQPLPLYVFCWLLLALNAFLSVQLFRALGLSSVAVVIAAGLALIHGSFQDLYLNAGTMYDRFCYLFTATALILYTRDHPDKSPPFWRNVALCILCMNSKESGVALPALLACYEACFRFGASWKRRVSQIAPLFSALFVLSLLFIFGRVNRTPELNMNPAYTPHAGLGLWLTRVAEYFSLLAYQHISFNAAAAALTVLAMLAIGLAFRSRVMIFGWLFFIITITPLAVIASRPGYVLYVPELGLAIFLGALADLLLRPVAERPLARLAGTAFIIGVLVFHVANWPPPDTPHNPQYQLASMMREKYPHLPGGAKVLFVSDNFPPESFDAAFCLHLLYHDRSMKVHRVMGTPEQQPDAAHPIPYDHVFMRDSGGYVELDNRDYKESVRLKLLRDFAPGRELDFSRRDYAAYVMSGVQDGDPNRHERWTEPRAVLKFDIFPSPATFTARFWLPGFVVNTATRTLTVLVNGRSIGAYPLSRMGFNELSMPVEQDLITPGGITVVELNVDPPYMDNGVRYGVILLRAGFEYRGR